MANAPTRTPAAGDPGYRAYLEGLLRKGDAAALEAELARAQLTRAQLDALVAAHSGAADWADKDLDLFEPQDANGSDGSPNDAGQGPQHPARSEGTQRP